MNQFTRIKTTLFALLALFYVSEALSATIKQKITPKNSPISIRSCAAPSCSVISSIPLGATGAVTDVSGGWIKVNWDGYTEGWLVNNDYYFTVLPDNPPNLSGVYLSSFSAGQREYFSGYATDDWNIRTVGMKVDGQLIFEESVNGKSVDFSKYYFDPNNVKYGKGSGNYSVQIYVKDVKYTEFKYFTINVASKERIDNPPNVSITKNYKLKNGEKIYLSGSVNDDYGLSQIEMTVENPLGQKYLAFTQNITGTSLDLSNYYFDSMGFYQGGVGQYTLHIAFRDTNGNSSQEMLYVNVESEKNNSAEIKVLEAQISNVSKISNENKEKASQANSLLSENNKKAQSALSEYTSNLKAQDSILSEGGKINTTVIPNDKRLEECNHKAIDAKNRSVCSLQYGTQTGSLRISSQEILIDYNWLTDSNYPAVVQGETVVAKQILTGIDGQGGALSDGNSWSSETVITPLYIANNQQQLKAIVNFLVNNKSVWSTAITSSFRDDIAKIAAASEVSDYSVFNIDRLKEEMLENVEMTLSDLELTPEQQERLLVEATASIIGLVPAVGNGKSLLDSLYGKDIITQEELSATDRVLNVAFIIVPQAKLAKLKKVADSMDLDGNKVVKALVRNNRTRGLAAAKKLKENPSLIDAALNNCEDHDNHITNKGVGKGKTGARYPDVICNDGLFYIESKVGYMSNTKRIQEQLTKDIAILNKDTKITIYWVFSKSSVTGKSGYSKQMKDSIPEKLRNRLIFKIIDKTLDN